MDANHSEEVSSSPPLRERRGDIGGKALKIIGKETFSREKILNTLGIEEEDINEAENLRAIKNDEDLQKIRDIEFVKNRRTSQKAIEVLGREPSNEKIKDRLGISQEELENAHKVEIERLESVIRRSRKRSMSLNDRRRISKALELLGHDPSRSKILNTLGMNEEDFQAYQGQQAEEYSEKLERKRSNSWVDRKMTIKAQRVLGLFPSQAKIMDRLGIDSSVVAEIELELYQKVEDVMRKKRLNDDRLNKRSNRKALKVLGHNPSEEILQNLLGVDKETIQRELIKNGSNDLTPRISNKSNISQQVLIASVVVAILGVCIYSYKTSNSGEISI